MKKATGPLGLLLIDDDEDVAALVETMVELDDRFALLGSARTALDGVELAGDVQPDVIVLDLHLPGMDGLQAIPHLRRVSPAVIVVFSSFPDPYTLLAVLERGADAYVDKAHAWAELLPTVAAAYEAVDVENRPPLPRLDAGTVLRRNRG